MQYHEKSKNRNNIYLINKTFKNSTYYGKTGVRIIRLMWYTAIYGKQYGNLLK